MNKNIKLVCNEISQGNNLEANLPQFFNHLATLYKKYSEIKFTLQYYTYYESYTDLNFEKATDTEKQVLSEINRIIQNSVLSDFSGEKMENNIQSLDNARNQIIKQMKILTAYTDIIQNFEYVLNRIEYRFRDDIKEINNDEFTADILRYIFDTKDNVIIHGKIQELIGQLPVRIAKTKYFDLLKDSVSIYNGADSTSLDTYLYMIKNGAMLYTPEGMDTAYPELYLLRKELESLDYANMVKEQYDFYADRIEQAAGMINTLVDFYYGLQELVNHLYVLVITGPYANADDNNSNDKILSKSIITSINEHFLAGDKSSLAIELEEKLQYSEGKQETLAEEFESLEYVLTEIKSSYINIVESLMLGRIFNCLNVSQNLLGNSIFIELNQVEKNNKVDDSLIIKTQDEMISLLSEQFKNCSKNLYRAIVANTINKMPVFFHSTNDVADYVKNSLEQCHDMAEKNACMEIIKSFWEN